MKLKNIGRAALAGAVSAGMVLGIAACDRTNTIDYLFVASSKSGAGQLSVYLVDGKSGVLTETGTSPYAAGKNPVALATTPDGSFIYVLNHDDNTIVSYSIDSEAGLKKANTYTTPGSNPTSLKINVAGTYLFVTDAFQPGYSAAKPGPGALVIYPIKTDGTLGAPLSDTASGTPYFAVCNNPVDLEVLHNSAYVYVIDDPAGQPPKLLNTTTVPYVAAGSCSANTGQIQAFKVASTGQATQVVGSPFAAGTTPTAIASDPTNRFIYVTDLIQNQLLAYSTESNGAIAPLNNGPFVTGPYPAAITVDPRGLYIYVANFNGGGSISAYAIAQATGVPSSLAITSSSSVTTGPTAVFVEPNGGKYLYSADFLDAPGTIFGLSLNANTGVLGELQNTPYPANGQPTAIAGVTHGDHPTEVLPQY